MTLHYHDDEIALHTGVARDVLAQLPERSVQTIVTSPPYFGLRDYGVDGQLGNEPTPAEYIAALVDTFREAHRVLADDGVLWVNLGDSYSTYPANRGQSRSGLAGSTNTPRPQVPKGAGLSGDRPNKSLLMIPARVAIALQDDGWILRNDVIWAKPNGMPESVRDRFTIKHEHLFMFTKGPRYYFDLNAVKQPVKHPGKTGATHTTPELKNPGDVWTISTKPFKGAHFAVFPPEIPERCVLSSSRIGDTVLDPFSGSATTGMVALRHGRNYIGIDLNPDYHQLALEQRLGRAGRWQGPLPTPLPHAPH